MQLTLHTGHEYTLDNSLYTQLMNIHYVAHSTHRSWIYIRQLALYISHKYTLYSSLYTPVMNMH